MGMIVKCARGQMTVELAVCIPVLVAMAVLACNAMLYLENCAAFDRLARDAVRVHAAAPSQSSTSTDCAAAVQASLSESFPQDYLEVQVRANDAAFAFVKYEAVLRFSPTLFGGRPLGAVFGLALPPLVHNVTVCVDPYRPGVLL